MKMKKDAPGSPDGIQVNEYLKNDVYDVPDALGSVFVAEKLAVEVPVGVPADTE